MLAPTRPVTASVSFRYGIVALQDLCSSPCHLLSSMRAHGKCAVTRYRLHHAALRTGDCPAEGGLTFQMKVNGQGPFATAFDSGAVNAISANFAAQLGLKVEDKATDFGAIGGNIKVHTAHVDTLNVGGLTVHNQTFYVLDLPSDQGIPQLLIGWEFLLAFAVRIDFQHNELTFIEPSHFAYTGTDASIPLTLNKHGNGIYLYAKVDGIRGRFLLDSGNEISLLLNATFVNKHHLQRKLHATLRGYNGKGMGGDSPEAWFTRLHTLTLGSAVINDPLARLVTAKQSNYDKLAGNIGQSILKHFTVTVDCRHRVLYLDPRADWPAREIFNRAGLVYDGQDDGDLIKTVFPGGPAEAARLQRGDLITAINGVKPTGDSNDPAFTQPVGTVLHLTVRRDGLDTFMT